MGTPDIAALEKAVVQAALAYRPLHFSRPDLYTEPARRFCETCDALQAALSPRPPDPLERLADALRLILPLAKGYAAANRHGINDECVRNAEALLAALDRSP